jgi:hypothetical protein
MGVELLDAERGFEHRFAVYYSTFIYGQEEATLFEVWGDLLRIECI